MKKVLSLILAAVMLLGCMSITAFAADSDWEVDGTTLVKYLGDDPFDLVIPDGITTIGNGENGLFIDCDRIPGIENLTIPTSVTSIADNAFQMYEDGEPFPESIEIRTIHVGWTNSDDIPSFPNTYPAMSFEPTKVIVPTGTKSFYQSKSGWQDMNIAEVWDIDENGVLKKYYGPRNGEELIIPTSVKKISNWALSYTNYKKIVISENVTEIGAFAFAYCNGLESISFPKSLTTIDDLVFSQTGTLTDITLAWDKAEDIVPLGSNLFGGAKSISDITFHVPYGTEALYNADPYWGQGINIVELPESSDDDFITSFTLNKDYNDKYTADTKSAKVNETLTYTIAPVTANAPAFANGGVVTMNVANGVGAVDVTLPTVTAAGEYWYTLKENAGTTAGVTYDAGTYYLHLVTYLKDGEYGVVSAALHTTAPAADGTYKDDDKITTITNTYGEGKLTVTEEALLNGAPNTEDTFTETVTFTSDKAVTGNITYGDNKTITPDMWQNGSVSVDIDLKGGESIVFENIPDGVTYNVVQKTKADGYDDATYTIDDEDGDEATATGITGTISDKADTATVHNEKNLPIDVGVILENGAFIVIAIGALALGAWLVLSKKKEREYDAE